MTTAVWLSQSLHVAVDACINFIFVHYYVYNCTEKYGEGARAMAWLVHAGSEPLIFTNIFPSWQSDAHYTTVGDLHLYTVSEKNWTSVTFPNNSNNPGELSTHFAAKNRHLN